MTRIPPPPTQRRRRQRALTVLAVGVVVVIALVVYTLVDPASGLLPRCPVKMLTGYDCPGCGSQRALHALLHGNFRAAWGFNPALIVSLPVIAILGAALLLQRRYPRFYRATIHPAVPTSILVAVVLWTILRNVVKLC